MGSFGSQGGYTRLLRERSIPNDYRQQDGDVFDPWALDLMAALDRCRLLCDARNRPWGAVVLNVADARTLVAPGRLQCQGPG